MTILCCGDRNWTDRHKIEEALSEIISSTIDLIPLTIIHGNANGADRLSCLVATQLKIKVVSYPANWTKYGRVAGPIRNQQMLDSEHPDLVLAFHSDIENSKGTKDMVNRARKASIPVQVIK